MSVNFGFNRIHFFWIMDVKVVIIVIVTFVLLVSVCFICVANKVGNYRYCKYTVQSVFSLENACICTYKASKDIKHKLRSIVVSIM